MYMFSPVGDPYWIMVAVTQILVVFVKLFKKSREENERQADAEKKKLEKEAMKERAAANSSVKIDIVKSQLNFQIQNLTLNQNQRMS